jgi:hypothetical protein
MAAHADNALALYEEVSRRAWHNREYVVVEIEKLLVEVCNTV